ncbi:hypothetical protein O988_08204 [Pseudogymnoascus sp. VKM F-3808]|nr:hypothetical protein O988_08204 [Pseudogymnoascus sp. VKM F-3808]
MRTRKKIIHEAKIKLYQYEREAASSIVDVTRIAALRYNVIPGQEDLIKRLEEEKRSAGLKEASADISGVMAGDIVGPNQIKEIVAKRTGFPTATLN